MFRDPVHVLVDKHTPTAQASPLPAAADSPAPPATGASSERESLADLDGGWGERTGRSPLEIHIERYFSRWLDRPGVQEVAINRPGEVALWEGGYWHAHLDPAITRDVIEQLGQLVANRSRKPFNASNVTLSTALPDGTRLEMTGPPATVNNHIYVNLRKHSVAAFTLDQFIEQGYFANTVHMFNMNMADEHRARAARQLLPEQLRLWDLAQAGRWPEFLKTAVLEYQNILVSGATGSGKTSFIRGLVELIPTEERILTVEDTPEMPLPNHPHCQALLYRREGTSTTAGGSAKDMLQAAMRKTPKRVLLAELRGDETYYYIQSVLNSGHPGGMTTTHANSPREAFMRLALLIKASPEGRGLAMEETLTLLHSLVNVVVQIVFKPGAGRYCSAIYYDPMHASTLLV
ncbi:type II secretion system protein E [Alicycliphilus sp. B1]|nr:type II secretion system protein E [Alicycliphilus sp. B1]